MGLDYFSELGQQTVNAEEDARWIEYNRDIGEQVTGRHLFDCPSRVTSMLPQDILDLMHAPKKPDYPILAPNDLTKYDAFLFGIPTRYGNFPGQWKVSVCSLSHRFYVTYDAHEGLLGRNWWALDQSSSIRQIRQCLREHGLPRRRAGDNSRQRDVHLHAPWPYLRTAWIQIHIHTAREFG